MPRTLTSGIKPITVLMVLGGGIGALVALDWYTALPPDVMEGARYVGRATCAECHQTQHDQWHGSHHQRAMELATEDSVLGDFEDVTFERQGVTSRFFRRDGRFFVHTEGPDGEYRDYEVKYTFGVDPLQQYMVELDRGRVQVLRVSWDTHQRQWFEVTPPDVPDERIEPGDPLHWTGIAQNWNSTCADCHSTNVQKNYDPATDSYHTTYEEINVSCEECHGPGSVHVELAHGRSLFWDRNVGYGLPDLKSADPTAELETCAKCHSRRHQVHEQFRPGKPLLDFYEPSLLDENVYHADGQILDEVYEYGSFLQSKMYAERVRCTDCHEPHSLQLRFTGNRLCAQCHEPARYDTPAHHHHPPASAGAQCIECHMPSQLYMLVDSRRDHSFRIPRPDLSVELGTPNACNNCHTAPEETAQWAADAVRRWYGDRRPDDPHWAPAIAAGRANEPHGEELLLEVVRRRTTPAIVRATAIDLLAGYPTDRSAAARRQALGDDDALVRATAVRALAADDPARLQADAAPRLTDRRRNVRIAAASRLAYLPQEFLQPNWRDPLRNALAEFRASQEMSLDRAGGRMAVAALDRHQGRFRDAAEHLRSAIQIEPYMAGPRAELASLLEEFSPLVDGPADPARRQLRGRPTRPPRIAAEEIRRLREEEVALLERDATIVPDNAEVYYRLGMLQYLLDDHDAAAASLEEACRLAPRSYGYRWALALLDERRYELTGDEKYLQAAVRSARKLDEIDPNDPRARAVLERLLAARKAKEAARANGASE